MAGAEREIFWAARECATPAERMAYLDASCQGSEELRRRVEALLRAEATAGGFLDEPDVPGGEGPGTRIHEYILHELIGEGGFGTVYRAEQEAPVRRSVALKIIKLGMDTRAVVARFEAERQALALMEHPNIARVLDGGATESGRPYFVMELVAGQPITAYCTAHRLALAARLELFLQVCRAVHHAHQKGVIHRDLKPSNILVAEQDGRPVVKVIDFGIAKATCDPLSPHTLVTRLHAFLGTPAYMSPEQMGLAASDIDTRSDIYSLGALLYELLTDLPALAAVADGSASYAEMQLALQRAEPVPPSRRLATLTVTELIATADRRRCDADRLLAELRGDLDRIVLKCLEKERARRYETTEDLARDIVRFLQDEPVLARPATIGYRASKFCRRHRPAVAAAVLAGAVLTGLAGFHTWRLAAERDRAQLEARKAAKISELLTGLLTAADPFRTPTEKGILENSASQVSAEFADHPQVRAEILNAIGRVHLRRGEHDKALPLLTEALATERLQPQPDLQLAQTLNDLGVLQREKGNVAAAVPLFTEALALRQHLLGEWHNDVAISLVELGRTWLLLEKLDEAEPPLRRALAIRRRVLGEVHRETAVSLGDLAILCWQKGDLAGAEPLFERCVAVHRATVGEQHPNYGQALQLQAQFLVDRGQLGEAEALARAGLEILVAGLGEGHWRVARARATLADVLLQLGRVADAATLLDTARPPALAALGPDNPLIAAIAVSRARCHLASGDPATAEALLREALRVQVRASPPDGWHVATTRSVWGAALLALNRLDEAEAALESATHVLRDVPGPAGREYRANLARVAELSRRRAENRP